LAEIIQEKMIFASLDDFKTATNFTTLFLDENQRTGKAPPSVTMREPVTPVYSYYPPLLKLQRNEPRSRIGGYD